MREALPNITSVPNVESFGKLLDFGTKIVAARVLTGL
jgi:hypothetical protein